jgi:hypothetical protein
MKERESTQKTLKLEEENKLSLIIVVWVMTTCSLKGGRQRF